MNKTQLIDAIASEAQITKVEARRSLDAFMNVTGDALRNGDRITLVGFGSFLVAKKTGRVGRDFRTGAPIKINPENTVKFRPGLELLNKIR